MSRIFSISDELDFDEIGDSLEEEFIASSLGGKGVGGEGKKGIKTLNAMEKQNREDAERQRKEEAKKNLENDLEHFLKGLNEGEKEKKIKEYTDWVIESLKQNYPYISDLDKDIDYIQSRSSGPGGQNVNKTSTAVTAKHNLTGIFSRSEDNREMLENKKESLSKLLERLEKHIANWKVYLRDVQKDKHREIIQDFINEIV